jgi:hypothetical protein
MAGAFLDGVNLASLALTGAVNWQWGQAVLVGWITVLSAMVSATLLLRTPNKTDLSTCGFSPRRRASPLPDRGFSPASKELLFGVLRLRDKQFAYSLLL